MTTLKLPTTASSSSKSDLTHPSLPACWFRSCQPARLRRASRAGTDPSVDGVIPGFADRREVELLVEAGFTPEEAIRICSLNAATYLGRAARVGSIASSG